MAVAGLAALSGARAGEAPKVSISGQTRIAYILRDVDGPGASDGADGGQLQFANAGTEIRIYAEGTADNGLTYGINLDLRPAGGAVTVDENYIFIQGDWGRVHIGGDDGAVDNFMGGAENIQVGNRGFDASHTVIVNTAGIKAEATWAGDTGDDARISYYSPNFSGFSAGVTVNPDFNGITDPTGTGEFNDGTGGGYGDMPLYEGGVRYAETFGEIRFAASAAYGYADAGDTNLEDVEVWTLGAWGSIAGFGLGAGIVDSRDTNVATGSGGDGETYWTVGAAYRFDDAGISTSYFFNEADVDGDNLDEQLEIFTVDVEYTLAEGLTAYAQYFTATSDLEGAETDTDGILIGTTVTY